MSHLEILAPFALPPSELAADLLRQLEAPSLAMIVARAATERGMPRYRISQDFSRSLPHETWLAERFGVHPGPTASLPIAPVLMRSLEMPAAEGTWFLLQPVHIHIARDHLVLTDTRQLMLAEKESRILFDIAKSLFEEAGMQLLYADAEHWFVRADAWTELQTSTPDAACGHNIDIWMPKGPRERDWRKVQNEVQMHWFDHPLNMDREAGGLKPVNSIWLWGGATAGARPVQQVVTQVFNLTGWSRAFKQFALESKAAGSARELQTNISGTSLAIVDAAVEPVLANDWGNWLEAMTLLENEWLAPLLNRVKSGALDRLTLIATSDTHIAHYPVTRSSLRKFWIKPSLLPLVP